MNHGGVIPVLSNGLHDAFDPAKSADAYVILPRSHAACQFSLTDFDSQRILPWQHSIQHEDTFLSPFAAVCQHGNWGGMY